jgi:hypothetical protein
MVFPSKKTLKEQKESREAKWQCWSCGHWNDSRESTCQGIVKKLDGSRGTCGAVRREA